MGFAGFAWLARLRNVPASFSISLFGLKIYTDWANRYLSKCALDPIRDLTTELRDVRILVNLVHSVTADCSSASRETLLCSLNGQTSVECIDRCLKYLATLGVNVSQVKATDLREGQLGSVLSLLYALSHFKQQQKALQLCRPTGPPSPKVPPEYRGSTPAKNSASGLSKKQTTPPKTTNSRVMPPTTSKLPSTAYRPSTSIQPPATPSLTKLTPPSKISQLKVDNRRPAPGLTGASALRPPSSSSSTASSTYQTSKLPNRSLPRPAASSSRLQPPSRINNNLNNNNGDSATSSCSSSIVSSATYSSIPSAISSSSGISKPPQFAPSKSRLSTPVSSQPPTSSLKAPEPSKSSSSNSATPSRGGDSKMLKIRFFGSGSKDKKVAKNAAPPATSTSTNSHLQTPQAPPAQTIPTFVPKQLSQQRYDASPSATRRSASNSSMVRPKTTGLRAPASAAKPATRPTMLSTETTPISQMKTSGNNNSTPRTEESEQKRLSKSSEEDSAYAGFGSNSPVSSAESSSMSINSNSSKTGTNTSMSSGIGSSTSSRSTSSNGYEKMISPPSMSSPLQERKPVLAVKGIAAPAKSKLHPPSRLQPPTDGFKTPTLRAPSATAKSVATAPSEATAQSPTVGVVSPMFTSNKPKDNPAENSDASTTSGSRDSDAGSVIYNPPISELQPKKTTSEDKKQKPAVPVRTTSRIETTFDSNSEVTVTDLSQMDADMPPVHPMPPIKLPEYAKRASLNFAPNDHRFGADTSTSEDSLDSVSTTIHCVTKKPSGYHSEGDSLSFPEVAIAGASSSSGYMSEGGLSICARKMQARFREGIEAVRHSMRNRHHDFNDSFEDSSSISSGISESFDDISTDDLTGSSLSDHPMSAAAAASAFAGGGKLSDFRQRRVNEQEQIDQLLQKCRTAQRGVACAPGNGNGASQQHRLNGYGNGIYHNGGVVPQLNLSEDGDVLSISRSTSSRSSMRTMPTRQDHHTQAGNGLPSMAGYHSLDRKCHLLKYGGDSAPSSPYRLSSAVPAYGNVGLDAATARSIHISPRHMTNSGYGMVGDHSRHSVSARGQQQKQRSTSLANSSGMSRSMVLIDCGNLTTVPAKSGRAASKSQSRLAVSKTPTSSPRLKKLSLALPPQRDSLSANASPTNGPLSARKPNDGIYANFVPRDPNLHLHKLSEGSVIHPKSPHSVNGVYASAMGKVITPPGSHESHGSQLSLASSSGSTYANREERYEAEIRKLNKEMDSYRTTISKLTAKHDGYNHLIQLFDSKLQQMVRHVESLQMKSQLKQAEVESLRSQIDHLRTLSINAGVNVPPLSSSASIHSQSNGDGAGELLRHQSMESVASQRSSMSSSSKSSKTDKSSLNSFGKQGKKSWIRSSFSRAFSKSKKPGKNGSVSDVEQSPLHQTNGLKPITGSTTRLDEIDNVQVEELKRQLEDKDNALTDVRLDALDKAREVDVLKETISRLRNENKMLKQNYVMLEMKVRNECSRASSQQSLGAMNDEDPVYEVPPIARDRRSYGSKRNSGCQVRVCITVDLTGQMREAQEANQQEMNIGSVPLPNANMSWEDIDKLLYKLFDEYIAFVDPAHSLGLNSNQSIIGYKIDGITRDRTAQEPTQKPSDVVTSTTSVRIHLKGVAQTAVDSLVLECLFPKGFIEHLLKLLFQNRRLLLFGATGIGKSNLGRQLARYIAHKINSLEPAPVHDIQIPDDDNDSRIIEVQNQLNRYLKSNSSCVILIDNIQRHRIAMLSASFASVASDGEESTSGPYVICTVNRACQLPEMQLHHNFRMFHLTNHMDAVKEYMGRFLRRRIAEAENSGENSCAASLQPVIEFLPRVLNAVNAFIEKANSRDVTIGPRIFLQCPLSLAESREWFISLWNDKLIPYMAKVAREGVKVLGRCSSLDDPTDIVCENWPWIDPAGGESVLQRLPLKDAIAQTPQRFEPLDMLDRLQSRTLHSQPEINIA
uniref:Calponin-homology (CH) domain-containing protein n=1 Tax=Steinernema glaseri TaxID=37863 RepID=A0A1I7YF36_9BILA